jgi:hypothetical protein
VTDAPQFNNVHLFQVVIRGCDKTQAAQVIIDRIDHIKEMDFPYTIEWEASEFDQDVPTKDKLAQIERKREWLMNMSRELENSGEPQFESLNLEPYQAYTQRYFIINKDGRVTYHFNQRPKSVQYAKRRGYFMLDRRVGEIINVNAEGVEIGVVKRIEPNTKV